MFVTRVAMYSLSSLGEQGTCMITNYFQMLECFFLLSFHPALPLKKGTFYKVSIL